MSTSRTQNRRRRVVFDEAIQKAARTASAGGESSQGKRGGRKRKYSSQARQSRRLADFIPKRWLTMAAVTLLAWAGFAALNLLDWSASLPPLAANPYWQSAFSFDSTQGLIGWFLTSCWGMAAGYSCLVYGLRRHRRDDYGGTYRIWLVLIAFCVVASLQVDLELDRSLLGVAHHYFPRDWLRPESSWLGWVRLGLILLLAGRMLVEMRHSKMATSCLATATLAATAAILLGQPEMQAWIPADLPVEGAWIAANAWLIAAVATMLATVSYARCVYMDVFGLRAKFAAERAARKAAAHRRKAAKRRAAEARQRERQEAKAAERAESAGTAPNAVDGKQEGMKGADRKTAPAPAAGTANGNPTPAKPKEAGPPASNPSRLGPLAARLKFGASSTTAGNPSASPPSSRLESARTVAADGSSSADDDESDESTPRLSKAERKRLKKLQSQNRRAA